MSTYPRLRHIAVIRFGVVGLMFAAVPAPAQEAHKPVTGFTPEQMLEEALRRLDAGDLNESSNYVMKVKQLKPELVKIKLIEGLLLLEGGSRRRPWESVSLLNEYNNSPEGKNDYRGNAALGRIYKESLMFQQAQRPLEKAKSLAPLEYEGKPLRAKITMDLAQCYNGQKKEKLAMATAKEAESMAQNDPGIQHDLGKVAMDTKDYDTAAKAADRAIALLSAKAHSDPFKMQDVTELLGCVDLKIKVCLARLDKESKDAQVLYDLAVAMREKGDMEKRLDLLKARDFGLKGIANDPKLYKLQVFVAGVEAELGGLQDAVDRLNDTINNDPENQAAIKLRSEIQARMGVH